jgi:hypothetical protein
MLPQGLMGLINALPVLCRSMYYISAMEEGRWTT